MGFVPRIVEEYGYMPGSRFMFHETACLLSLRHSLVAARIATKRARVYAALLQQYHRWCLKQLKKGDHLVNARDVGGR